MMIDVAQLLQECSHVEKSPDVGVVVGGSLGSSALLLVEVLIVGVGRVSGLPLDIPGGGGGVVAAVDDTVGRTLRVVIE